MWRPAYLSDPMHFHRTRCLALLQRLMIDEHIIPLVGHPELIIPKEVPHFLWSCILKDSTTLILGRSRLNSSKQNPISIVNTNLSKQRGTLYTSILQKNSSWRIVHLGIPPPRLVGHGGQRLLHHLDPGRAAVPAFHQPPKVHQVFLPHRQLLVRHLRRPAKHHHHHSIKGGLPAPFSHAEMAKSTKETRLWPRPGPRTTAHLCKQLASLLHYIPLGGGLVLLPPLHGGRPGVAERRPEAGGELGLPEVERGVGRLRGIRCVSVGGGDETGGPARAPGPAEQEADEGRRPEGPREERHLPDRPPRRGLLQHPRHRRQHVPHRSRPGRAATAWGDGRAAVRVWKRGKKEGMGLCGLRRGLKTRFFLDFFSLLGREGKRCGARVEMGVWGSLGCAGHGAWTISLTAYFLFVFKVICFGLQTLGFELVYFTLY